jgi:hypothetical protein
MLAGTLMQPERSKVIFYKNGFVRIGEKVLFARYEPSLSNTGCDDYAATMAGRWLTQPKRKSATS